MKEKINKNQGALTRALDMPQDIMMNLPKITITGNNEIIIENHKGVLAFSENEITVNSTLGLLKVEGCRLEILFMGGDTIVISGRFKTLIYEENS